MAEEALGQEDTQEVTSGAEDACPEPECPAGAPAWMVTYGDMMTLLMCFFVLIVSFSTMDVIKYRSLVGSLQSAFGSKQAIATRVITGKTTAVNLGDNQPGRSSMTEDLLEHELTSAVEEEGLTGEATLHRTDRGLVLRVRGHILFDPGGVTIRPESLALLKKVGWIIRQFTRTVYVEGHTDNLPVSSDRYGSNWELSSLRASAVVRYLQETELLPPERFVASGLAATVPIASNSTSAGRAKNRRVEFVFSGRPGADDW